MRFIEDNDDLLMSPTARKKRERLLARHEKLVAQLAAVNAALRSPKPVKPPKRPKRPPTSQQAKRRLWDRARYERERAAMGLTPRPYVPRETKPTL